MYVIGVAGQAQMGKDTLSDYLVKLLNEPYRAEYWTRTAFARGVKKVFGETFDRSFNFIEEWKVKPEPPPGFEMSVRKSLQFIGDGFRQIRPSIWIDLALRGDEPRIISDVRYINEFRRIHEEGGLNILVGRTEKINDDPNPSESQIKPYVEWCLRNFSDSVVFNPGDSNTPDQPAHMGLFDIFIRNDRSLDEFYKDIEANVLPYVRMFSFEKKEKE